MATTAARQTELTRHNQQLLHEQGQLREQVAESQRGAAARQQDKERLEQVVAQRDRELAALGQQAQPDVQYLCQQIDALKQQVASAAQREKALEATIAKDAEKKRRVLEML